MWNQRLVSLLGTHIQRLSELKAIIINTREAITTSL